MIIEELSKITKKDLEEIAELLTQLRGEEVTTDGIESDIQEAIDSRNRGIIVARDDDEIQGVLVINILIKLGKRDAKIDEFVVDSNARGGGIGKKIITAAIDWAWDHNCKVVELTSRPSRVAANHLYQKLGFALRKTNVYVLKK